MFDDAEKGQFHCDGCGICRVGGRENYFHCDICGYCLPLSCKDNHKLVACYRQVGNTFVFFLAFVLNDTCELQYCILSTAVMNKSLRPNTKNSRIRGIASDCISQLS